jgi:phage shock protein A
MFMGLFGLAVSGIEKNNPEALLENEKNNLRKQIAKFNGALAAHAGEVERLGALAKKLDTEENDLRVKIKGLLQIGKRDLASTLALKLQDVDKRHDEILAQLQASETQYKELTKARDVAVKGATKKIEELSVGITDLKIKSAAAELSEMATGMISSIGSSGDSLNRISALVEEERNKAAGRARVAADSVDMSSVYAEEATDSAMAEVALANFEAELGISTPPSSNEVASMPKREMNPA